MLVKDLKDVGPVVKMTANAMLRMTFSIMVICIGSAHFYENLNVKSIFWQLLSGAWEFDYAGCYIVFSNYYEVRMAEWERISGSSIEWVEQLYTLYLEGMMMTFSHPTRVR